MATPLRKNLHVAHQITTEVLDVSPSIAERWLGKNTKNRPLKSKVELYARDMIDGKWQLTGEAIKFDTNGDLLDGQNRLHAVIRSGVTVPMLIVYGLSPAAQEVMDTGVPRSSSDALHLRGHSHATALAASLGTLIAWRAGHFPHAMTQHSPKLTNSEILQAAEDLPSMSDSAVYASSIRRTLALPVGVIGACHFTFSEIDADDCEEFFARIRDLRTTGAGDPVNTLIKRVNEVRDRRERVWVSTALYFLVRAWNACRSGEPLTKLQIGSEMRGWTEIPEPK